MRDGISKSTVLVLVVACLPLASADSSATGPAVGVARVSVASGDIAIKRGDSGDWIAAIVNMPVVQGDSVQSVGGSKVELQLDYGNFVRLGPDTEVELLELARQRFRIRLLQGTLLYSELSDSEADIDIETPSVAVRPQQKGQYRVEVGPESTVVAIRQGEAEIATEAGARVLARGRALTVRDSPDGLQTEAAQIRPKDALDRWAAERDKVLRRARTYRFISRDIYGADLLDQYGDWRYVVGVGYSWFPRVWVDWVPYRHGRWIWVGPYGWTWVGHEPWGWAPYHWGRWYRHAAYGWGWFPGHPRLRHVWRPALVAFFGIDYGVPVGWPGGFRRIGWCPLAPGERYVAWAGARQRNQIIVDNSVRITNVYRNARGRHAVSYVDAQALGGGARQTPRALRTAALGQGVAIRGPVPVVPDRASQGRIIRTSTSVRETPSARRLSAAVSSPVREREGGVPFDMQRERLRASVDGFRKTSGNRPLDASDGGRATPRSLRTGTLAGGGVTVRAPGGAATRERLPTAASAAGRPPPSTSSARTQPRSRRLGQSDATGPAALRGGQVAAATPSSRRASTTSVRSSRSGTAVRAPSLPRASARAGSPSSGRADPRPRQPTPSGAGSPTPRPSSPTSVYVPRTRSRIGATGAGRDLRRSGPGSSVTRPGPPSVRARTPSRSVGRVESTVPSGRSSIPTRTSAPSSARPSARPRVSAGGGTSSRVHASRSRAASPRPSSPAGSARTGGPGSVGTSSRSASRSSSHPTYRIPSSGSRVPSRSAPTATRSRQSSSPRSTTSTRSRPPRASAPSRSTGPARMNSPSGRSPSSGGSPRPARGSFGSASRPSYSPGASSAGGSSRSAGPPGQSGRDR